MVEQDKDALTEDDPAVGSQRLVVDETDHLLYLVDDAGVATLVGGGGSSDLDAIIAASSGQDIADALAGAAAPDSGNVFATMADVAGGGGAPTTAEYVTTAADAGLSAERVIDLGALTLLQRRAVTNTEDDLFNAALDGRWTSYGSPANNVSDKAGWLHVTTGGYYVQAVAAGDYTIETEVIVAGQTAAGYQDSGLILTNGTTMGSATDIRLGVGHQNSLTRFRFVYEKFVNGSFSATIGEWNASNEQLGPGPADRVFIRCRRTSTTNFTMDFSYDGWNWHQLFTSGSIGFTPTHFGIGGDAGSYFNSFHRY
jgi:hypothetical protein